MGLDCESVAINSLEDSYDYRRRYAQLITRRPYQISAGIKFNPHNPGKVSKDLISSEYTFFNAPSTTNKSSIVKEVYLGGKLNAYLSLKGDLYIMPISSNANG